MPDPPPEVFERTVKVVGPRAVLGHQPGETFTATLTAEQEHIYVSGGHLEVVGGQLASRPRDELNELARGAGVPDPEQLPNKQAVVDAIEAARTTTSTGRE